MKLNLGPPPHGVQEHEVVVEGSSTTYLEAGSGPAVLLLHGNGGSSRDWNSVILPVASQRRVVAIDLPGYGNSAPQGDNSPEEVARFVWSFVDALGMEDIVLVGHSWGGLVAMRAALMRPDPVSALVLVASAGLGRAIEFRQTVHATMPSLFRAILNTGRLPGGAAFRTLYLAASITRQPWRLPPSWWDYQMRLARSETVTDTTADALQRYVGPFGQTDVLTGRLTQLNMPTLVVWGVLDNVIPAWQAAPAAERLPRGELCLLPYSGHMPHVETVEEFLNALIPFLSGTEFAKAG